MLHCRRNIKDMDAAEQRRFRDAVFIHKERGLYDTYVSFHGFVGNLGHFGPAFLPWHRMLLRRFEQELQVIDPGVTLPYWDFTDDNMVNGASKIWNDDLFGAEAASNPGPITLNWTGEDGLAKSWVINREAFTPTNAAVSAATVTTSLGFDTYQATLTGGGGLDELGFRRHLENNAHGSAHVFFGSPGDQGSFATAINDPIFMLLHANVDRLWSIWQQQKKSQWVTDPANAGQPYPAGQPAVDYFYDGLTAATTWPDATTPLIQSGTPAANRHNLDDVMWPWDGSQASPNPASAFAPWNMPGQALSLTPRQTLSTVDMGFIYDTDQPDLTLKTPSITFNAVPEGQTTVRAAVFDVRLCSGGANIEVVSPGPGASFSMPFGDTDFFAGSHGNSEGELRIWFAFTGTTAGSVVNSNVEIRNVETGQVWSIPISASTIANPTVATALVLDRSGSMNWTAGLGDGRSRIDVLRSAVGVYIDAMDDTDAVAIASFNGNATPDVPMTAAGVPLFGAGRIAATTAVTNLSPGGSTSIGDGIETGAGLLPASGFDHNAMVVFTDGHENAAKTIAQVAGMLTSRTFAVGLGAPSQLSTAALDEITSGTGGFLMMTGDAQTDELRLAKYFLQVLAGVTNAEVVLDPAGSVHAGDVDHHKFSLTNLEYRADVFAVLPHRGAVQMQLISPTGQVFDPVSAAATPGMNYVEGRNVSYYRFTLPAVSGGVASHGGTWVAELTGDPMRIREYVEVMQKRDDAKGLAALRAHGVPYRLIVNARSSISMDVDRRQRSREVGSVLALQARIAEMGIAPRGPVDVWAEITDPKGDRDRLRFDGRGGRYQSKMELNRQGTYQVLVKARGQSHSGLPFTREQLVTASVWDGGDRPIPKDPKELPPPPKGEEQDDKEKPIDNRRDPVRVDNDLLRELLERLDRIVIDDRAIRRDALRDLLFGSDDLFGRR